MEKEEMIKVKLVTLKTVMLLSVFICSFICNPVTAQSAKLHTLKIKNNKALHQFFSYKNDGSIIVSGHRGGREIGFSENCIEGLNNVLKQMPAFLEIDPRLTKDSVAVLMHDATLDRTSTGTGKISDYTWSELQSVRLKDKDGNVTDCRIPKLEDVIKWSKGKTIINLDKKDVPMEMIVRLIKKHHAENWVMLTVHSGAQAKYYYDRFPGIMMSAFARDMKEYNSIAESKVPWKNFIAYVGPTITPENEKIVEMLHAVGVKCMVSFAPTSDKLTTPEERLKAYQEDIAKKPDIIESDIPTEVWSAIHAK